MSEVTAIPIIKLYGNLIVSIQTALSDKLVMQLKDDITFHIEKTDAYGLIIDISGIDIMDSYISRAIRDMGLIAQMMGVQTVICGMDPMISLTLVEMGLDLTGIRTSLNLETAIDLLRTLKQPDSAV